MSRTGAQSGLKVANLCLMRQDRQLLSDVSFALSPDDITVVMGPNGAGKSLLLQLLHGLMDPTSGEIFWDGEPPSTELTRSQALVFQKPVLLRRSVAANVDFILNARGKRDAARRNLALKQVGLLGLARAPARRLSGGEQQRLALARAIVTDPETLLLDEPTANLDPNAVASIEEIVRDVANRGTKVVFVTHDIGQARRMARDVLFLDHGRVTEHTEAAQFFDAPRSAPAHAYLAGRLYHQREGATS